MPCEFPTGIKFIATGNNNNYCFGLEIIWWTCFGRKGLSRDMWFTECIESFHMDFFNRVLRGWVFESS